jgi:hypothetical protein
MGPGPERHCRAGTQRYPTAVNLVPGRCQKISIRAQINKKDFIFREAHSGAADWPLGP